MRNIAVKLSYDGAAYHGWQTQRGEVTVQQTLERAAERVLGHAVKITGCGRTDAGVHARTYCAGFETDGTIPAERIPFALNSYLPPDVSVSDAADAPPDFNAILSCEKKEYTYRVVISRVRDPFLSCRAHFVPRSPDAERIAAAAKAFAGTHDFAAVRSVGTETRTTVRTVYWCETETCGNELLFRVCADGFLYNMARAIVGTLLYVSEGKLEPEDVPAILASRDRRLAGPTAPPGGLYLTRLWYPGPVGAMFGGGKVSLNF
ncbi:MAG: tRNA pseudouridine(38-40) synthase TruA [Oscillospiraceae bacterium]|nr:tRNA pseudouridine(38-40) synthase TruA [Oscillospiraceae bacterium]